MSNNRTENNWNLEVIFKLFIPNLSQPGKSYQVPTSWDWVSMLSCFLQYLLFNLCILIYVQTQGLVGFFAES